MIIPEHKHRSNITQTGSGCIYETICIYVDNLITVNEKKVKRAGRRGGHAPPRAWEAKAGENLCISVSSKPVWSMELVPEQLGLHKKTLSQKQTKLTFLAYHHC